jgi:hypothetical protein
VDAAGAHSPLQHVSSLRVLSVPEPVESLAFSEHNAEKHVMHLHTPLLLLRALHFLTNLHQGRAAGFQLAPDASLVA